MPILSFTSMISDGNINDRIELSPNIEQDLSNLIHSSILIYISVLRNQFLAHLIHSQVKQDIIMTCNVILPHIKNLSSELSQLAIQSQHKEML